MLVLRLCAHGIWAGDMAAELLQCYLVYCALPLEKTNLRATAHLDLWLVCLRYLHWGGYVRNGDRSGQSKNKKVTQNLQGSTNHHLNLIDSFLSLSKQSLKIWCKSVHPFSSYLVHKQTNIRNPLQYPADFIGVVASPRSARTQLSWCSNSLTHFTMHYVDSM